MKLIAALTLGVFVAGCEDAYAYDYSDSPAQITLAAGHGPLTNADGMTLYTFDNDSAGTSACYEGCEGSWPPYLATGGAAVDGLTTIERRDGTLQYAKDGAPLYLWVGDSEPGDATGDGVGGVWHIAK